MDLNYALLFIYYCFKKIGKSRQADPLPPSRKSKSKVVLLPAPSRVLIGQSGAPKLRVWSELRHHPQLKFTIDILTTTRIILIEHQTVVYAYPKSRKSNLVYYRCILSL